MKHPSPYLVHCQPVIVVILRHYLILLLFFFVCLCPIFELCDVLNQGGKQDSADNHLSVCNDDTPPQQLIVLPPPSPGKRKSGMFRRHKKTPSSPARLVTPYLDQGKDWHMLYPELGHSNFFCVSHYLSITNPISQLGK